MTTTQIRPRTSIARLLGAALVAAPLAASALGLAHAHAATPPTLTSLVPAQQNVSGYARTPSSVAVSGNTAIVGSIGDEAAYIFVKTASGWAQQARLADPDTAHAASDLFGSAVAIHGNTVLVGDPAHVATDCNATPNQQTGAVFQFDRTGTTWAPSAFGSVGCSLAGDKLGTSVAFDGNDAVLGAPGAAQGAGVAYLLHQVTLDDWQQQQILRAGDGQPGDGFGTSVAISGTEALAGAPGAMVTSKRNGDTVVTSPMAGAAYTFGATGQSVKSGNAWAEQSKLIAPVPTTGASFGASVALGGNQALIGAPFDKNGASVGAAYLATRNAATGWSFPVALPVPAGAGQFGGAVALGTAGGQTKAVIGDYGAQAAFIFAQSGATFSLSAKLTQAGALGLGSAVATDGTTALLAAIYGNNYQGAAFVTQIGVTAPKPVSVAVTVDDTNPSLVYSGTGWGYYGGRPASFNDLNNDVHATLTAGDAVSYTFSGTGVSYISEKSAGYGMADVYIDGAFKATVDPNNATASNMGGQTLFRISGLPSGRHTITIVSKNTGIYTLIDDFQVR